TNLNDYLTSSASGNNRLARTESYRRYYKARGFTVFSITGDKADETLAPGLSNGGCNDNGNQADPNNTIIDVAETTGGAWGSICPPTLNPPMRSIGLRAIGQSSPNRRPGVGRPISSTPRWRSRRASSWPSTPTAPRAR